MLRRVDNGLRPTRAANALDCQTHSSEQKTDQSGEQEATEKPLREGAVHLSLLERELSGLGTGFAILGNVCSNCNRSRLPEVVEHSLGVTMIDEALNVGSTFDWISPVLASAQDIVNGPSHTFLIPDQCGWSGYGIRDLLHRSGVQTWGLMIVSDTLMVSVPKERSSWAFTVLSRNGIPVENPPETLDVSSKPGQAQPSPARDADHHRSKLKKSDHGDDMVGSIVRFTDWLNSLLSHFRAFRQFQDDVNRS